MTEEIGPKLMEGTREEMVGKEGAELTYLSCVLEYEYFCLTKSLLWD
jgi:hypothetical protein